MDRWPSGHAHITTEVGTLRMKYINHVRRCILYSYVDELEQNIFRAGGYNRLIYITGKNLLITTVVKVQNCGEIKVKTMTITSRCQGFFSLSKHSVS